MCSSWVPFLLSCLFCMSAYTHIISTFLLVPLEFVFVVSSLLVFQTSLLLLFVWTYYPFSALMRRISHVDSTLCIAVLEMGHQLSPQLPPTLKACLNTEEVNVGADKDRSFQNAPFGNPFAQFISFFFPHYGPFSHSLLTVPIPFFLLTFCTSRHRMEQWRLLGQSSSVTRTEVTV